MSSPRLQVTRVENSPPSQQPIVSKGARRQEMQAIMERQWLENPGQFDPERDAVQRKRLNNTIEAIKKQLNLTEKRVADLGCGPGNISRLLRDEGATIDALDIAKQALERLKSGDMQRINVFQDCLPYTRLDDNAYDLIVCTEVIGYLNPKEYRMLFAELSRLVNKHGFVACSTSLDLNSDNALERFAALAETEFEIDQWILQYDLLWIKLCRFFEAPQVYLKGSKNRLEREKELNKRKSFDKWWYKFQTTPLFRGIWAGINLIASPIASYCRQNERMMIFLEKLTKFIWSESGISHALFIGKRRPMTFPLPPEERPIEIKHKRQVWD